MQRISAIAVVTVLRECEVHRKKRSVWIKPELKSGLVIPFLTVCFFGRMMANSDLNEYLHAYLFHPCKIGRSLKHQPGSSRCPPGHRPMLSYTDAGAPLQYVTTQGINVENRPAHGRFSISPVICKSLKSYVGTFVCDHSIKITFQTYIIENL